MKDTIQLTLDITVKDLNQTLALLGQELITSDEELEQYEGLTFSSTEIEEMEGKVGMCALVMAAKALSDEKNNGSETP